MELLESIAPLLVIQAYIAAIGGATLYYLSARRDSRALRRRINAYEYACRGARGKE